MQKLSLLLAAAFAVALFSLTASAQQRFVANLSGAQEVPANNSTGRGVCTVVLNTAETQIAVNCSYSGLSSNVVGDHIHGNALAGANAGILFNFNFTGGTSGSFSGTFNVTAQQVADMRGGKWYVNVHTSNFPGGEVRGQIKRVAQSYDFDGDGRSDINVTRPATATTYYLSSVRNALVAQQFGQPGDFTGAVDTDGDGLSDFVRVRVNPQTGAATILILRSSDGTTTTTQFGNLALGDAPVLNDYDGDGKIDIAAFRRSTGVWTIIQSSNGQTRTEAFGQPGDNPAPGDYDGDGRADLAVQRVLQNGQYVFYIRRSSTGAFYGVPFGTTGDGIFSGSTGNDIDGDGKTDIVVARPQGSTVVYYGIQSSDGALWTRSWGSPSDGGSLIDQDGDGKSDVVATRKVNGSTVWYVLRSSDNSYQTFYWGLDADNPY